MASITSGGCVGGSEEDQERPRWGASPTKLKVLQRHPKKARLWLNDGSCICLQPKRLNYVYCCELVEAQARDGRKFRMLNLIDDLTRECLTIRIDRNS